MNTKTIQDALNNLRVLEQEEARMAADNRERLLQESVEKLKSIAPKIATNQPDILS